MTLAFLCACSAYASDLGLTFQDAKPFEFGLLSAQHIAIVTYTLAPQQSIVSDLCAASARGANVSVVFSRNAFGEAQRNNIATERLFIKCGVKIFKSHTDSHLKLAILDSILFFDDTNFSSAGEMVRDDIPGDRAIAQRAILGIFGENDHLWTRKADALAAEARVALARASHSLDVSSESFGPGTTLYETLILRARLHDHIRLIVARREAEDSRNREERQALGRLAREGVEIRYGDGNEKMLVDGDNLFLSSANATTGYPNQIEWGIAAHSPTLAAALKTRFAREWAQARL